MLPPPPPPPPFSGDQSNPPHFALLPSAGMGHLIPFSRLAAALSARNSAVSFITTLPTVSSAESRHISHLLSLSPLIRPLPFSISPFDLSSSADPFFLRWEAIRRSAHLLPSLLSAASPPVSALIIDVSLASAFVPIANTISLPSYILFTSSAAMLSLWAFFPIYISSKSTAGVADVEISGLLTVPKASIPPALHDPHHIFTTQLVENGKILQKSDGILINTFEAFEPEALAALNKGEVVPNLPPVIAIGPLRSLPVECRTPLPWLDEQPARSVVYVSFGSRTAMSRDQIKELGIGLESCGWRFLWVVKSKKVDREEEEEEEEEEELLGDGFLERVKGRGMVVKGWVEQEEILSHESVGGFVSHCGWNSVSEAAMAGVRVLGWPRGGDQRVNGEVVRRSGVGIWVDEWSWEAEEEVVKGEEIGKKVRELMEDEGLNRKVERVRVEAERAVGVGGSSDQGLEEFIGKFKL